MLSSKRVSCTGMPPFLMRRTMILYLVGSMKIIFCYLKTCDLENNNNLICIINQLNLDLLFIELQSKVQMSINSFQDNLRPVNFVFADLNGILNSNYSFLALFLIISPDFRNFGSNLHLVSNFSINIDSHRQIDDTIFGDSSCT